MQSKIARSIRLKVHPVALLWSDEEPVKSMRFQEGRWGCVMWLVAAAAKGRTAACSRSTFGCFGGGVGMGFGNQYTNFPGGVECFCRFLSVGNETWEEGRQAAEQVKPFLRAEAFDQFVRGERYMKSPEQVRRFIDCLPMVDIPARYVVFKPLGAHLAGPPRRGEGPGRPEPSRRPHPGRPGRPAPLRGPMAVMTAGNTRSLWSV
jgi:hypothetical protein